MGKLGKINFSQIVHDFGKVRDQFGHPRGHRRHHRIFGPAFQARRGELLGVEKIQLDELQAGDAHQVDLGAQPFFDQPLQGRAVRDPDHLARTITDHILLQLADHGDL